MNMKKAKLSEKTRPIDHSVHDEQKKDKYYKIAEQILNEAHISINGPNPWDIQVHDSRVFRRVFKEGSLGLGESYMDGWWDCEKLDEFIFRVVRAKIDKRIKVNWKIVLGVIWAKLINPQSKRRAFQIGERHYDLGNELFQSMLDKRMTYSCGYWKNARTLDEAQEAKLRLICEKIKLEPGMRVLDIGCGWGSFIRYAAENYGASCVGITVSKEQVAYSKTYTKDLDIEVRLQDYRELDEKFDRIVSVGMIEHVGYKNYRTYMKVANKCLKDDGLFLLHAIGRNTSDTSYDPWINKYIFPNGMLPSLKQLTESFEHLFVVEDLHNFGADYDKTLMSWYENFNDSWHTLSERYDERFYRMWKYYLLSCAGAFRARSIQLWQFVLSKNGILGGYQPVY